jgi:hypothetical protein
LIDVSTLCVASMVPILPSSEQSWEFTLKG